MNDNAQDNLSVALFSEIFMADQMARVKLARVLPKGMELSHFSVLNHLSKSREEKTPGQLARVFHVTRGAMTNTVNKLAWAGYVHIRPDWDDARRKFVAISPAGRRACDEAFQVIADAVSGMVEDIGSDKVRAALPVLRAIRLRLDEED
ncbi:MarR family winged helix-turn-helix transcriptional regulator [Psychromarinibacter halotolerans]|mgnify:CR=1 FL=1|uniref:MarR family winged helix-turn-helix transcriptional regulator n=1 Tax=Psychromarinibacter halotolerans TaxID=1775175 RepID=A0ABV7GQ31_9RHOB|nr:MarR family transcriptional regulator [Psychromarinibacter halotolerans]MAQ85917.1 MarR family transcriptional regulator [Maritimibacter sp.]MDF0595902.1 MarR family transcriptional regulator [Psychromarinibacter halotolerans]